MIEPEVHAAGGVVWRRAPSGVEILLVHRPRYDDWSFPKGKRDPGESDEACALREVEEETALRCRLGGELPPVQYLDHRDRPKRVRYWAMEVDGATGAFVPNDEVDQLAWVQVERARRLLSYSHDVVVLDAFTAGGSPTVG